jgi:hypothetical protein
MGAGIAPLVTCLIVAVVCWGAFKAFGWDLTFLQDFGVTAHAFVPGILGAALLLPILASRESVDPEAMGDMLRSNPGFLVDRNSSKILHSLLQSIGVFSFWSLALLTTGSRRRQGSRARLPQPSFCRSGRSTSSARPAWRRSFEVHPDAWPQPRAVFVV